MKTLRFSALDTWFFRESRPMEAIGGSELASVFPPPPRTLLGAVRTAIGDADGIDWQEFANRPNHPLRAVIGFGDDLGPLALSGPWLSHAGERLYPAPLYLLRKGDDFKRLCIGAAVQTHLGSVRLPVLPGRIQGYKPLERAWITGAGLERVLMGAIPDPGEICSAADLYREEARLGIARDNRRRTPEEGALYQTRHLRPHSTLAVEADLTLPEGAALPTGLVRFGGEGRLAHLASIPTPALPAAPTPSGNTHGLILVLLTAARLSGQDPGWLPHAWAAAEFGNVRVWQGPIAGVSLTLHAAVLGKAHREGGWDMANHCPRPVQSLIPAGSAYYVTVAGDLEAAIANLHGAHIGDDQTLGRGLIACGLWNVNESLDSEESP